MNINIEKIDYESNKHIISNIYNTIYVDELKIIGKEYSKDEYDDNSFHILIKNDIEYIGYVRMIQPFNSLPAFEIVKPEISVCDCIEISRLMILKHYRSNSVMLMNLFKFILRQIMMMNYSIIIVDCFYKGITKTNHLFESIGFKRLSSEYVDPRFINQKCILCYCDLNDLEDIFIIQKKMKRNIIAELLHEHENFRSEKENDYEERNFINSAALIEKSNGGGSY